MGLDGVEMVMEFEDVFGVAIPDDVAESLRTIQDTVDWIAPRVLARPLRACSTSSTFYRFRRTLVGSLGVDRAAVRPNARLHDLTRGTPRRKVRDALRTGDFVAVPRQHESVGEYVQRSTPRVFNNRDEVLGTVIRITSLHLGVPESDIHEDSNYVRDLGLI